LISVYVYITLIQFWHKWHAYLYKVAETKFETPMNQGVENLCHLFMHHVT